MTSTQASQFGKSYLSTFSLASSFNQGWLRYCPNLDGPKAVVHRMARDVDENSYRVHAEEYLLNRLEQRDSIIPITSYCVQTNPKVVLNDISPSGLRKVIFCNTGVGTNKDSGCSVEISRPCISNKEVELNYKIDLTKYHGKVIGDSWFGGCSWSHDEKYFVYVAQGVPPATKTVVEVIGEENCENLLTNSRNKFEFVEDWGEKYTGVTGLKLFVLNVDSGSVVEVKGVDINRTVGQPIFLFPCNVERTGEYHLAYTAWDNAPRKLGMIYCYQRAASIYLANVTNLLRSSGNDGSEKNDGGEVEEHLLVSPGISVARSPRSGPTGKNLVFLGNEKGYLSHGGCSELFCVDIGELLGKVGQEKWLRKVVAQVGQPYSKDSLKTDAVHTFPGLFLDQLPRRCFVGDDTVVLSTVWESCERLVTIPLSGLPGVFSVSGADLAQNERVHLVSWQDKYCEVSGQNPSEVSEMCFQVLDQDNQFILGSVSSPIHPPRGILLSLASGTSEVVQVKRLGCEIKHFAVSCRTPLTITPTPPHQAVQFKVFRHQSADDTVFNSILLYPISGSKCPSQGWPVIVVPHGGPHSVTTNSFMPAYTYLVETLGAVILHVNYRGSTGFGQHSVQSLLGKVGSQDVSDVMEALQRAFQLRFRMGADGRIHIVDSCCGDENGNENGVVESAQLLSPLIDKERVGLVGGSHGGFLSAHLCGQYPNIFRACCLRNPVTNIPSMSSVTDIPDWCHVEACGIHTKANLIAGAISNDDLVRMRNCSPIAHIDQYRAPTLVCVGMKDRRVPCSQGIEFFHLLKDKCIPTRLMAFPEDVHAIDLPASEAEHWIAIGKWIATYL